MIIKYVKLRWLALVFSVLSLSCSDDEVKTRSYPVVDTEPVSNVNEGGAQFNGNLLSAGTTGILDYGFVYDNTSSPTLEKSDRISMGENASLGKFSVTASRNLAKGVDYYMRAYAISKGTTIVVYGQQYKFRSEGGEVPTLDNFEPKNGAIGDTIVVTGSGFSNSPADNQVYFGTLAAEVIKATPESLSCIVPASTPTGQNDVAVGVAGKTTEHSEKFNLEVINFTAFTPSTAGFGDTVTIVGNNFPRDPRFLLISMFGRVSTIVKGSTKSQIKIIVSERASVTESSIEIHAGSQTVTSSEMITLSKPKITGFLPVAGTAGTLVTISGDNFNIVKGNNLVELNGISLTVTEATEKSLKVTLPAGIPPGSYPFVVTILGQAGTSSGTFQVE